MERFAQDVAWVEDENVWNKIKSVWKSFREEWKNIETQLEEKFSN